MNHEKKKKKKLSMDSPICRVPELKKIVRVVSNNVSIKAKFSLIHGSIVEVALFIIFRPVKLFA